MEFLRQTLAVRVTKKYQDEVEFSNGEKLFLDVSFNPEHHVTISGEVVALPRGEWCKDTRGRWMKQELELGDHVYFNYLTVDEDNLVTGEKDVYLVELENVFCKITSDGITPVAGHVLIEPKAQLEKVGSIWVGKPEPSENEGFVRHIGVPYKDEDDLGLVNGDLVYFHDRFAFLNKIEDVDYYVMKQEDIEGKIESVGGAT